MDSIKRGSVAERVVEKIVEYITLNEMKPGDKLPTERELSEQFGVGRPAIREALCALSVMRIIDVIQGDGIYFANMPGAFGFNPFRLYKELGLIDINQLFEMWIFLEADAAELAASRITGEQLSQLEGALGLSKTGIEAEKTFLVGDDKFHNIICQAACNPLLTGMLASIKELIMKVRTTTSQYYEIRQLAHAAHERIYEAIKSHNPVNARRCMEEHLKDIKKAADLRNAFYNTKIGNIFRKEFNIN